MLCRVTADEGSEYGLVSPHLSLPSIFPVVNAPSYPLMWTDHRRSPLWISRLHAAGKRHGNLAFADLSGHTETFPWILNLWSHFSPWLHTQRAREIPRLDTQHLPPRRGAGGLSVATLEATAFVKHVSFYSVNANEKIWSMTVALSDFKLDSDICIEMSLSLSLLHFPLVNKRQGACLSECITPSTTTTQTPPLLPTVDAKLWKLAFQLCFSWSIKCPPHTHQHTPCNFLLAATLFRHLSQELIQKLCPAARE